MEDNAKDVLTDDNDKGKERVLKEDYAFLMESSSIEYIQERECDLAQIGGLLDSKGYGIAMRKRECTLYNYSLVISTFLYSIRKIIMIKNIKTSEIKLISFIIKYIKKKKKFMYKLF